MNHRMLMRVVIFCIVAACCDQRCALADFVVPASLASAEGDGFSNLTNMFGTSAVTRQIQIAASELTAQGLMVGHQITGVRMRTNGDLPPFAGNTTGPVSNVMIPDLELTMAQARNLINAMSLTFADNMTSPVMVHNGSFTIPANSMPGGSSPNIFGVIVPFTTAYTYLGGDLVFMWSKQALADVPTLDFAVTFTGAGTHYAGITALSFQATTATTPSSDQHVLQFVSAVPEARAWLMIGVVTVGAATLRLMKRLRWKPSGN